MNLRHFAVANNLMTSLSYPQMVQGLHFPPKESVTLSHDPAIAQSIMIPKASDTPFPQFYEEISKQSTLQPNHSLSTNGNLLMRGQPIEPIGMI